MKKIIFFDIDGTISSLKTGEIPESAVRAIRKARENGHLAFINTGRTLFSVQDKYKEIGFDEYVCGCGTAIYEGNQRIYKHAIPEEKCLEIMRMARKAKVSAVYESEKGVFFDHMLPKHASTERLEQVFGIYRKFVPEVLETETVLFEKFCFWKNEETDFDMFYNYISQAFDCASHGHGMYELMPKGVSKATGIQFLMDYYGIPLEDCYALGDSTNDLAMLQFVPNSIAMGSCMEEILPYCAYQTADLEDDGLEKALQHYGII